MRIDHDPPNLGNMKIWSFLLVICLWKLCGQALDQCEMTLSTLGVMRISIEDTAAAAQVLSESFHVSLLNSSLHYMRALCSINYIIPNRWWHQVVKEILEQLQVLELQIFMG